MRAVGDGSDGAELKVAGDSVKKRVPLDEEKIDTKNNVAVVRADVRWKWGDGERRDTGGITGTCGLAREGGNVRAVDGCGTLGVGSGHGAIEKGAVAKDLEEFGVARAAEEALEPTGDIGVGNIAGVNIFLLSRTVESMV